MTNEMRKKVENELKRAYAHFGERDEEICNTRAVEEAEALICRTVSVGPETIQAGNETLVGYTVDIAITSNNEKDETVTRNGKSYNKTSVLVAQLLVTKSELLYVLNAYDAMKPEGWEYGDGFECENETYKKVTLEDIDVGLFS